VQKAHLYVNPRRLSHFAWRSVGGSDRQACSGKKSESHRDCHGKDMSLLTQGLNYRSACDKIYVHIRSLSITEGVADFTVTSRLTVSFYSIAQLCKPVGQWVIWYSCPVPVFTVVILLFSSLWFWLDFTCSGLTCWVTRNSLSLCL